MDGNMIGVSDSVNMYRTTRVIISPRYFDRGDAFPCEKHQKTDFHQIEQLSIIVNGTQ
jgi:hypothetical protein